MRLCKLFDKYRDGELNSPDRSEFESHLAGCENCQTKASLLNNVARLLKMEETRPRDLADLIARKAFARKHSWDAEVISWLRPGPALAALTLMLILVSSLWIVSSTRPVAAYSEYETFMDEADSVNLDTRVSQVRNDSELVVWLEQEGDSQ